MLTRVDEVVTEGGFLGSLTWWLEGMHCWKIWRMYVDSDITLHNVIAVLFPPLPRSSFLASIFCRDLLLQAVLHREISAEQRWAALWRCACPTIWGNLFRQKVPRTMGWAMRSWRLRSIWWWTRRRERRSMMNEDQFSKIMKYCDNPGRVSSDSA